MTTLNAINKEFRIQKNIYGTYDPIELKEFYLGEKPNADGLYINDIWALDNEQLEKNHTYIQWLFPLSKQSRYNPYGPIISDEWIHKISTLCLMNDVMNKSFTVMLDFYGFKRNHRGTLDFADDFHEKSKIWLTHNNHNYKRITRILNSLSLFEMDAEVSEFRRILRLVYEQHADVISQITARHWGIL